MIKQVIVIRRDLNMRRGKEIAQGAHAAMMWLVNIVKDTHTPPRFSEDEWEWLTGSFTKVTLQVDTEAELLEIVQEAKDKGLKVNLVTDSGKTEFKGLPTNTCCAIGPNNADDIDEITKHKHPLKPY